MFYFLKAKIRKRTFKYGIVNQWRVPMFDLDDLFDLNAEQDNSDNYMTELFPDDVQEALFESGLELEFE